MISGMLFVLCLTLCPFKAFPGLRCCHVLGLLIEQNDWVCTYLATLGKPDELL